MIMSTIYRCEYCGKEYLDRTECETCETSHGHNIALHKKLEKILKSNDVFYRYDDALNIMSIYKVKKIYNEKEEHPECYLVVEILELYIENSFDWYKTHVNDCYNARYFINEIENERWHILTNNDDDQVFKDISAIIASKEELYKKLSQDPIMQKYYNFSKNKEVEKGVVFKTFSKLFNNRKELDQSLTETKHALKGNKK